MAEIKVLSEKNIHYYIARCARREPAKATPDGVELIFLWSIVVISERKMEFQFWDDFFLQKKIRKNLYCAGGGWTVVKKVLRFSSNSNLLRIKL